MRNKLESSDEFARLFTYYREEIEMLNAVKKIGTYKKQRRDLTRGQVPQDEN